GAVNDYTDLEWMSGVSAGDNKYYQFTAVSNDLTITPNSYCYLSASFPLEGFEVSRDGVFSGTPLEVYENHPVKIRATDENNLTTSKILYFSTDGANYLVIDDYSVVSGDDDIIGFGETASLSVDIKSLGDETITGAAMTLSINDQFITLTDSLEVLGDFDPGEIKTFSGAFVFEVDSLVPDEYSIDFNTLITDDNTDEWSSHIYLTAYRPDIYISNTIINDGDNGVLDPGETTDLVVTLFNSGQAKANNITATLFSSDPFITINSNTANLSFLSGNSSGNITFNITASADAPTGHIAEFMADIVADFGYITADAFNLVIGHIPILIIDLDGNHNSANSILQSIENNGAVAEFTTSIPPDLNLYSSIFLCLGIYSQNHVLSSSEGDLFADFMNNGGKLYMEGGDIWAYDPQTAAHNMFNIDGVADGTSDMSNVSGQSGTFTEGMNFSYSGDNAWMDHIEAIAPAYLILENDSPVYGTAVAYDAGSYKTIGTGHEFGGLTDGAFPSTKDELMKQYLDFFGLLPPPVSSMDLKVLLEGPFNGTDMNTDLTDLTILPLSQPFNTTPWNYNGTENVIAIPGTDIVDWVLVEFRDAPNADSATQGTMFARQAAFLLNDGSIKGIDGVSYPQFSNSVNFQLFVVIWHRNHLGVLSSSALVETDDVYFYDFSLNENQVYGGITAHKEITDGIWGMVAGDGNCDGYITDLDKTDVWDEQAGEAIYLFGDFNLDGNIDNKDKDDILIPNLEQGYSGQGLGE
ncbi:MAG: hypothetical protein K8S16_05840, partial [Bacteroidales bacterium]|nr:hypothetical protein [Bacteroidales bacterium]